MPQLFSILCLLLLVGCGEPSNDMTPGPVNSWKLRGAHGTGSTARAIQVEGRIVPVRVWYPSESEDTSPQLHLLVSDDTDRANLAQLLLDAPDGCPATDNSVTLEAVPAFCARSRV
jgi:hypothetical protein